MAPAIRIRSAHALSLTGLQSHARDPVLPLPAMAVTRRYYRFATQSRTHCTGPMSEQVYVVCVVSFFYHLRLAQIFCVFRGRFSRAKGRMNDGKHH